MIREIDLGIELSDDADISLLSRCVEKGIIKKEGAVWIYSKGWKYVQ